MRYCLQALQSCYVEDSTIVCPAATGTLRIEVYSSSMLYFSYELDGIDPPQCLKDANRILKGAPKAVEDIQIHVKQDDSHAFVHIYEGGCKLTIIIEKSHGNLEVKRNGVVVSGGLLGNMDTVIPRVQVRGFRTKGSNDAFVRLNFPLNDGDAFYGLGDKSGKPDRFGRRLRMYNKDSLAYDASFSDPLYKSIPFFIRQNRSQQTVVGYYFPQSLINVFDFGQESPFYTYVELEDGPVGYYLLCGDSYRDILPTYCSITGFAQLPPLFSFGFFGSSMNYVEPEDAAQRILAYFSDVESHQIPCEGMYVSSGYLKADDGNRYAFFWNKKKFPDYATYLSNLHDRGYNLTMNIKPGILTTHPWYDELASKGYFVHDDQGRPLVEFYWGGEASFIDFSNPEAKRWWKDQLKDKYISHGCTGIWNDNNEFEIEDPDTEAFKVRTLLSLQMVEASYEAFNEMEPDKRHWIYTRSGYAGIQKYARTWSGDNTSTWRTLLYNQYQSIGLGLSGLPFYGHDLGGFFGDIPSEELLVRSCQSAVFQPRFVIHSWRSDGNPTEPWTYPESFETIRYFIREHYRFMPYIYSTAYEAATTGTPMDRPLFLEFSEDPQVPTDQVAMMFGPSVLKLMVVHPGERCLDVYLPEGSRWYDPETCRICVGGRTITFDIPMDQNRYLAKVPSVIPTSENCTTLANGWFDSLVFHIYPGEEECRYRYFEDDGQTSLDKGEYALVDITVGPQSVHVVLSHVVQPLDGRFVTLSLPRGFSFQDGADICSVRLTASGVTLPFSGAYREGL